MRRPGWILRSIVPVIVMLSASAPAHGQTYDPAYPVCLQIYQRGGGYIACGFSSMSQCQSSASGRAAQCLVNPYYKPAHRRLRRPMRR